MKNFVNYKGCRFCYEICGSGPGVLLIQGVGVHGSGWRPQTAALAGQYSCLTYDNRGLGLSQPAGAPLTVAQMADDAQAVLDAAARGLTFDALQVSAG